MRVIAILFCVLVSGCDDKVLGSTEVQGAVSPLPVVAAAACEPFDVPWLIDVDAAGPTVTLVPVHLNATEYRLEERSGDPWQFYGSGGWRVPPFPWTFDAHFDMSYRASVKVGECWSSWHEFRVGPKNPDASNGQPAPFKPALEWHQCSDAIFTPPPSYAVEFIPPVQYGGPDGSAMNKAVWDAPYQLTVTTYDRYHRPGYQVGQVETVKVEAGDWVGFTQDIPDAKTEISQTWDGIRGHPIRITGSQGSVHGVCVTVRQ